MAKPKKTKAKQVKEEKKDNSIMTKFVVPFYTNERWQNWINQVKESDFKIDDEAKIAVFVNMVDDVILACLKLISKYDNGLITKDDTNKYLSEIKEIVLKKIDPITEDVDMMLESTQTSLIAIFASCDRYIDRNFEKTNKFDKFIKNAVQAEQGNNIGVALDNIAIIGANIISGEKLKESDLDITSELVAEWIDGIDSISVAMMGDTSYKQDEPDSGD